MLPPLRGPHVPLSRTRERGHVGGRCFGLVNAVSGGADADAGSLEDASDGLATEHDTLALGEEITQVAGCSRHRARGELDDTGVLDVVDPVRSRVTPTAVQ